MKVDHRSLADYGDAYIPQFDPPVIIQYHFPKSFCELVLEAVDSAESTASGVYDSTTQAPTIDTYHRSSSAISVSQQLYEEVALIMTTAVNMHSGLLLAKRATLSEPLQFLKYEDTKRGHFLPHTDNAYYDGSGIFRYPAPHRHLTCIAYLNENYDGGDLVLNSVRGDDGKPIRLHPKVGELVIFPSDLRFTHEVTPVLKGKRYSIVGWYSLK